MKTQANEAATRQQANEVISTSILNHTFTTSTGEGDKTVVTKHSLKDYRIKDKDGDGYTVIDILWEALDVQVEIDKARIKAKPFAEHMMLLAKTCSTPDQFRQLLHCAEESIRWGKAPKGLTPAERNMYNPAPQTYQDYKSRILKAWEAGIVPGREYTVETKVNGEPARIQQVASSPALMVKIAGQKQAQAEAKEQTVRGAQAGVEVTATGNQKARTKEGVKADILANSTEEEEPEEQASDADIKVMAACISLDLAGLLSRTLELYENAPETDQNKALDTIKRLNDRLAKVQQQSKAA